jgi:hypothetical protein
MDLQPFAWTAGLLAFAAADLYAVGGAFSQGDLLLVGLGAAPALAFGLLVTRSRDPMSN